VAASGGYGRVGDVQPAVQVVEAIYDAFARRDLDGALTHMHEEIVFVPAGTASLLGRAEPYVGHDGVRRYFADVAEVWTDLTLRVDDIRAVKEGVVVFGSAVGRTDAGPYEHRAMWTWKVQGGRATSMRVSLLGRRS
jgi:ketosteroid isomerase-like protein